LKHHLEIEKILLKPGLSLEQDFYEEKKGVLDADHHVW